MFQDIKLEDKKYFDQFNYQEYIASELNFANIYAWKDFDKLQIYKNNSTIIIKGRDFFFPPMTTNPQDFVDSIFWIKDYCIANNFPFSINGVTKQMLPFLEGYNFRIFHNDNFDEYIYSSESLINYSGKKYHAKRNFVNQFLKNYEYQYLPYEEKFFDQLILLIDEWTEEKGLTYEKKGIISLLENLEAVSCFCDCLFIENNLVAFSIGTIHNNTGIILFEKANPNFKGIYPFIVQKFSERHFQGLKYINRQEDMGIENLEKSKLSYYPLFFEEKYQITMDLIEQLQNLYNMSFNDSENYKKYFFNHKEKTIKYLLKKHNIASVLYYRNHQIRIWDYNYQAAFLFAISTAKFYRNQGYMRKLIAMTFNELYSNFVFAYLHPNVTNFYEKFGFTYFGANQAISNDIKTTNGDLKTISEIYRDYASKYDAYTLRDIDYWNKYKDELEVDSGYLKLTEDYKGYIAYDGKDIIEFCHLDYVSENYDYNMIRIVNLNKFIEVYNYRPNRNIKIIDDIISENNISMIINDGELETMTIADFTKEIFSDIKTLSLEKY